MIMFIIKLIFLIITINSLMALPTITIVDVPSCIQFNNRSGKCYSMNECLDNYPHIQRFVVCERDFTGKPFTLCCDPLSKDKYSPFEDDDTWAMNFDFECGVVFYEPLNNRQKRNNNNNNNITFIHKSKLTSTDPVVGGFEVSSLSSRPWQVAIWYSGVFICGGSIISKKTILTAAHCFQERDAAKYWITVGSLNLTQGEKYLIDHIILHDDYSPPVVYNDIALIIIKDKLRLNHNVNPICLANKHITNQVLINTKAIVTGFGTTSYGGLQSQTLQEVSIPLVDHNKCNDIYLSFYHAFPYGIINKVICAGYEKGGKDSCQGDSGGPLAIKHYSKWIQIGLVSYGYKCAEPGYPGVYTNVAYYYPWIKENMKF